MNSFSYLKNLCPGLSLVFFISFVSVRFSHFMSTWVSLESLTIGIVLSMVLVSLLAIPGKFLPGISFSLKKLLKWGIVLLGFKMNYSVLISLGPGLIGLVCVLSPIVLFSSWLLGRKLGLNSRLSVLIGVGSSICGASAVVAMAPCIKADDDDAILAVTVISFLGAVGVILYTFIGAISPMSDIQFGLWSGLSLQGVAHALAAAFARGGDSGEAGTFIKMARVLMLVPVSVALSSIFGDKRKGEKASFPLYVLLFLLAGLIGSVGVLPSDVTYILGKISSWFILMAMVGMGLSVDFKKIRNKGGKTLLLGGSIFTLLSVTIYFLVVSFF